MVNQARWMLELLDRLGIQQAAVVAHDVGTAAAQLILVRAPERIRALALMDGVYGGEWGMEAVASIQSWEVAQAGGLPPAVERRLGEGAREIPSAHEGGGSGRRLLPAARGVRARG